MNPGQVKRFYQFGPFRLDPEERMLWRGDVPVPLTIKAFDTLLVLVEGGGRVISKDELLKKVWPDSFVEENNLSQQVSYIRKALEEAESGIKYIETLPKRGYRFVAEPREIKDNGPGLIVQESIRARMLLEEEETTDDTEADVIAPLDVALPVRGVAAVPALPAFTGKVRSNSLSVRVLLVGLVVLSLVSLAYFFYSRRPSPSPRHSATRTLAILPFRNLKADGEADFLGFSLADAIITKLGYVSTIIVRPSSYVDKYRNQSVDPKTVAAELNVNTLLTGGFIKDGDDLRINAQLVDVETNEILWRDQIDLKYERLLTVQDNVAQHVIDGLKLKLSPTEVEHLKLDVPHNALAYEYYLRGVDLYSANNFKLAAEMFEQSVALDPAYALAWAHLGTAYTALAAFSFGGREDYQKAQAAYQKALELNPEQVEARVLMANLFTDTNRVVQAVPLLREVVKANPNYALAHWELGYAYRFAGMLDQSIAECDLARTLDPKVKIHSSALNSYLYAGQYERFLRSLPANEDIAFIRFYRGLAHLYLKNDKSAAADFDRAYELEPSLYTQIGKALSYGLGGDSKKGLEVLNDTERKIDERGVSDAEAMYKVAQGYAILGDKSSALRMLRRGIEGGFFCYPYIKEDPLLANLRDQAEYTAMLNAARQSHEAFKQRFF
jgi:DNA-binding winged helix-turn-helix (wHTH) protein/TolB-like protein/Tfp pilus assembly protein PilF